MCVGGERERGVRDGGVVRGVGVGDVYVEWGVGGDVGGDGDDGWWCWRVYVWNVVFVV